ncbi:MAG: ATP-binding protein, partial [Anaerolineae bacterium]
AAVDSFVGRERELGQVRDLLCDPAVRLVTLVGAGGMGKTRLALEAARGILESIEGGAWLVEIVPLATGPTGGPRDGDSPERSTEALAAAVAHAVSSALHVTEADKAAGSAGLLGSLVTAISSQAVLIILDSCEPLLEGAAPVAAYLLAHCPNLRVLATSREPLRLAGEHLYQVPPLDIPSDPGAALVSGAVRLLAERVAAARYGATIDEHNANTAMEVCRRLDGMPLAIELAAARLSALTLEDLASRLDGHEAPFGTASALVPSGERWALLSAGSRAAHPRQRTLLNTLAWSYGLLEPEEQRLFERLSVFSGSFSLAAVESICDDAEAAPGGEARPSGEVRSTLAALVDCSLVQRVPGPGDRQRY